MREFQDVSLYTLPKRLHYMRLFEYLAPKHRVRQLPSLKFKPKKPSFAYLLVCVGGGGEGIFLIGLSFSDNSSLRVVLTE